MNKLFQWFKISKKKDQRRPFRISYNEGHVLVVALELDQDGNCISSREVTLAAIDTFLKA